jgi:hypothetical protein
MFELPKDIQIHLKAIKWSLRMLLDVFGVSLDIFEALHKCTRWLWKIPE